MMRFLNVLALVVLIGSAISAYSVKYETILVAEKLKKREGEMQREKERIDILKAEWELLNRPSRLQALAPPEAGMHVLSVRQIARVQDIPQAAKRDHDALASLMTGSLPASVAASKPVPPRSPEKLPIAATPRPKPVAKLPATPRPLVSQPPKKVAAQPLPLMAPIRPPAPVGRVAPAKRDAIADLIAPRASQAPMQLGR